MLNIKFFCRASTEQSQRQGGDGRVIVKYASTFSFLFLRPLLYLPSAAFGGCSSGWESIIRIIYCGLTSFPPLHIPLLEKVVTVMCILSPYLIV